MPIVRLHGHLLDHGVLSQVLNYITEPGGSYEFVSMSGGQRSGDLSTAVINVFPALQRQRELFDHLVAAGCEILSEPDAEPEVSVSASPADGTVPDDFYSTTNHPTYLRMQGNWVSTADLRMDCCIVVGEGRPRCRKLRDVRAGESVVVGHQGIRVVLRGPGQPDPNSFCFMSGAVSSERNVNAAVADLARELVQIKARGGRTVVVAGPAVVHTGASPDLAWLIAAGYVQAVLAGNALAVHDIEAALYNTSLGVDLGSGSRVHQGHRHHLRAINAVRLCGGIAEAVRQGLVDRGIMYECVRAGIPFSLAGSIRDDGPLPETRMDLIAAQDEYARLLDGADLVLIIATLLHAVGVANMLPSSVRTVCVDINPATVLKLVDRGSGQVEGLVTDAGPFLRGLVGRLGDDEQRLADRVPMQESRHAVERTPPFSEFGHVDGDHLDAR